MAAAKQKQSSEKFPKSPHLRRTMKVREVTDFLDHTALKRLERTRLEAQTRSLTH